MIKEITLRVQPEVAADTQAIKEAVSRETGEPAKAIRAVRILRKSIDARRRHVLINLKVRIFINEDPDDEAFEPVEYPDVSSRPQAVVVGAGPAGLFAALRLIELGIRPVVLERGKNVHERRRDIALISREHRVDGESNYCFGEGGAGAFSDGKLFTRSKKRGSVEKVLRVLCQHGASTSILIDAHPHIGTDKLPKVIENIRRRIESCGGEVRFGERVDGLLLGGGKVAGVYTALGMEVAGPVILATGHSARDVYRYLCKNNIALERKGMAMGVRLEHPQSLIDKIQYHNPAGRGRYLPAAEYSFVTQVAGRGVYSFCMCPGGFVVPSASGGGQVVVNGMSPSTRSSRWANAAMVVEIRPEDCGLIVPAKDLGNPPDSVLGLLYLQEHLERMAWEHGGRTQVAPAQRMEDFVRGRVSSDLPPTSYTPGVTPSALHRWMPEFITGRLREGFKVFGQNSRGFLTNEALMIGVETRTSSPVRIPRDPESLCHLEIEGLYPCGEGAGYAGGIVSAAIDGERCAGALAEALLHEAHPIIT